MPFHALFECPGHRQTVGRDGAVLARRDLRGEHREQVALFGPACKRLVEDARGVLILVAIGEVWVEQRRRLPPEQTQHASATTLCRGVDVSRARLCDARVHQQHRGHRCREAGGCEPLNEAAPRQVAVAHRSDQAPDLVLVHVILPWRCRTFRLQTMRVSGAGSMDTHVTVALRVQTGRGAFTICRIAARQTIRRGLTVPESQSCGHCR